MRKSLVVAAMLVAMTFPALAQEEFIFDSPLESSIFSPPVLVHAAGMAEQIARRDIAAKGWCDRPAPAVKPGQVVIYYARDAQGVCTARARAGG